MSRTDNTQVVDDPDDPDLDILLGDALTDFGKRPASVGPKQDANSLSKSNNDSVMEEKCRSEALAASNSLDGVYGQLQNAVLEAMQSGQSEETSVLKADMSGMVQQLTEELARVDVDNSEDPFAQTLLDLSRTLASDAGNSSAACDPAAEVLRRLGTLGAGESEDAGSDGPTGGEEGIDSLLQFTQSVMASVLSKSVLYGPLKDVAQRYPDWLNRNADRLDAFELQRYRQQLQLMERVCAVFDEEDEENVQSEESAVRCERQQRVFELMQQMQALGQPPAELVGDSQFDWQLDGQGTPSAPPSECSLM